MASISRPNPSYSASSVGPRGAQQICLIVGLTCIVGFLIDAIALGSPPDPGALEWRISFMQQMGDRSIVLLFGSALLLYSLLEQRQLAKQLGIVLLIVGILFQLSCVLVIRDSLVLQKQTLGNIDTQAEELQTQIDASSSNPDLPAEVTPDQLQQISQQVTAQAESLRQNARTGITKALVASLGNLVVVGLGLIGLGRVGSKRSSSRRRIDAV